jgi:hypothetical protein
VAPSKATAEAAADAHERDRGADDYQGRCDDIAVKGARGPVSPLLAEGDASDAFGSTERPRATRPRRRGCAATGGGRGYPCGLAIAR